MSGAAGTVVQAADVPADQSASGTSVRRLVDTSADEPGLVRRLVDLAPLAKLSGSASAGGELWFVIEGAGQVSLDGQPEVALRPDRGFLLPPGCAYRASAGQAAGLRLDTVSLPHGHGAATGRPLSRDFADCEVETTGDRQFRVLFGPGRDCAVATQFVGEIPPGRAPDHSHPYDEVVLILAGQGIAHIGGVEHALTAGACAHLPPGLVHCLENTGPQTLRVLGVFHPADSPAAKLEPNH
ncbi:MAG TPA: cupin domain-containing protein [Streptosporangiaceae bacterium]|nr:cupin domain-containing protein [Streptosporangiaceae bacterium]